MTKPLTAIAIAAAKPRDVRYEVSDGATPGLRLIVQPSGVRSWAIRYRRPDGATAKLTLGAFPAIDLKTARARALEAVAAVAAGLDPGAAKKAIRAAAKVKARPAGGDTTADAVALFIRRHAKEKNRESVWREAQRILEKELAPWATRRLADIRPSDVHAIMDSKMDAGSPASANRSLAVLKRFFRFAVERGLIPASPCAGIGAPAPTRARERVLSAVELAAVWRASESLGHPFGPVLRLLMLTGQRRGEVGSIRTADIDLDAARWTVPSTIAKNGRAHVVHLAPPAVAVLREAIAHDRTGAFLFGGKTPPSGWSKAKRRLDVAIGSEIAAPWTIHDIRRSVATGMAEAGIAVPVIERLLNHVSGTFAGVVGTYQRHEFLHEREEALTRWGDFVSGLTV